MCGGERDQNHATPRPPPPLRRSSVWGAGGLSEPGSSEETSSDEGEELDLHSLLKSRVEGALVGVNPMSKPLKEGGLSPDGSGSGGRMRGPVRRKSIH